jgi:hypothetical protein
VALPVRHEVGDRLVRCRAAERCPSGCRISLELEHEGEHDTERRLVEMKLTCGVDWAEEHHDMALVDEGGAVVARARIDTGATGFSALLRVIAQYGGSAEDTPVAIETDKKLRRWPASTWRQSGCCTKPSTTYDRCCSSSIHKHCKRFRT